MTPKQMQDHLAEVSRQLHKADGLSPVDYIAGASLDAIIIAVDQLREVVAALVEKASKVIMYEYLSVTIDEGGNYTTLPMPDRDDWHHINDLGKEGWELVCVGWFRGSEAIAIFKREISEKASEQ